MDMREGDAPMQTEAALDRGESIALGEELVSVIVPIYQVEKYLKRCLDSLKGQTYPHFEALLVDDGSRDGSAGIALQYAESDARFRLIRQENGGQGAARNHGLKLAKGRYIMFLDSDDWVDARFIETLLRCLQANDADMAICGVERVWENGARRRNTLSNDREYVIPDVQAFLLHASCICWDKLYKRELLEGLRFPERMKFEDTVFTPQAIERAGKIVAIPDPLYFYFWREDSTTTAAAAHCRDIYRAHQLLRQTPFAGRNPRAMAAYFVRYVMGSMLWTLCHDRKNLPEIKRVMAEGLDAYPDLRPLIPGRIGPGKERFGYALLKGRYGLACLYASTVDWAKDRLRPAFHQLLSLKKGRTAS